MTDRPTVRTHAEPTTAVQGVQRLVREIWRYKWIVPAVAALVTSVVAFFIMRQPRIYEATATLEYDPRPTQPLGSSVEDTSAAQASYWTSYEFYETQNYVLKSRALAERVVRNLGLQQDASFMGYTEETKASFKGATAEQAAQVLLSNLTISLVADTRIVQISVRDRDPDRAQLLANTLAATYIEKSLDERLSSSAQAIEWLGNQMESLKQELESSELALYKFRESNDSLSASLEERQKIITGQLQAYSQGLTAIRTERIRADAKLDVLRQSALESGDTLDLMVGRVGEDPTAEQIRSRRRESATELEKLLVTYGPAHPLVRSKQTELSSLTENLRLHINSIVQAMEADMRELAASEQGFRSALAEVNQQGLELSLQEIEYTRLDRERKSKLDLFALVMERFAQTDLTRALRVANARILDRAVKPNFAISPKVRFAIAMGLALGLMLGIAIAFLIAQLDNKVRGISDLEARGLTVLGVVPAVAASTAGPGRYGRARPRRARSEPIDRDLIVHQEPRSTIAECCRTIRTNITFQSADNPPRMLAVTSAQPQDGKTTIATSLAITLAQSGKRVLVIDTDLRRPRAHKVFKLPTGPGVTSVLAGETTLDEALRETGIPNLSFLQCGPLPPNPSELLHTRRFAELAQEAREKFDMVVFDTPPLGAVTDPAIIATVVDGIIVVVRARKTTRSGIDSAIRQLSSVSARIIGVVLNDVDLEDAAYGQYYAYYRGYYGETDAPSPPSNDIARTRA